MIVITGAAGFIGSCLTTEMNQAGYTELILVDDFSKTHKQANYQHKKYIKLISRDKFIAWAINHAKEIQFIIHLGARTDTTDFNHSTFDKLNFTYSKDIWNLCANHHIPLIYASSAATYGMGEYGFKDDENLLSILKPMNPYAESKHNFDKWAIQRKEKPFFWAGLKFFNVYGPNEYHKGRMASVIFHAFNQIQETGKIKLFRSHHPNFKDGEQMRDFIYVKDVCKVIIFLMENRTSSGIYNLGTGKARTFLDLAIQIFEAMGINPNIEFIDTPKDIRDTYQYFTQAEMGKLREKAKYTLPFYTLEEGVKEYVQEYLLHKTYY
ncbi:MAG: ADP-glyceromanno-heptose 6-epimerase [Bacteroidia bacterium]|nr:ADP-glyceromanno-heptose 6-epimerase [Bacteroidia bacterium]MDW8346829.1 ADP-glyceromanno-heptose 6-epimerase [Bacteroidia bacterium]